MSKKKKKLSAIDFASICGGVMLPYRKESISHCGLACAVIYELAKRAGIRCEIASCRVIDPIFLKDNPGHHFIVLEGKYVFDLTLGQFFGKALKVWPVFWEKDCDAVRDIYGKYKVEKPTFQKKLLKSVSEDGRDDIFTAFLARGLNQIQKEIA